VVALLRVMATVVGEEGEVRGLVVMVETEEATVEQVQEVAVAQCVPTGDHCGAEDQRHHQSSRRTATPNHQPHSSHAT
jgi:hypothetical protein